MKNYESTVSTEVNGLSFSFLSSAEIKSLSCSEIKNAGRIDHESAGKSCIYDPSMGSTEIYRLCSTCNEMTNCDGHLGHINFAIPLFHPMMINSLCKLLKAVCFYCGNLRLKHRTLEKFTVLFEASQSENMRDMIILDKILSMNEEREENAAERDKIVNYLLHRLKRRERMMNKRNGNKSEFLHNHTEMKHDSNIWNEIRDRFFNEAAQLCGCSYCEGKGKVMIKPSSDLSYIEVSWHQKDNPPKLIKSLKQFIEDEYGEPDAYERWKALRSEQNDKNEEEEKMLELVNKVSEDITSSSLKSLNQTGKSVNMVHLQSFHLLPYLDELFRKESEFLNHLFPQSRLHGYKIFFMDCMGVSANRFRPPLVTADKQIVLHSRSTALLDIVMTNEFVKLLLQFKYYSEETNSNDSASDASEQLNGVNNEVKPKAGKLSLVEYLSKMNYKIDEKQLEQFDNYLKDYKDLNEAIRDQILNLQKKLSSYMDNGNPRPGIKQTMEHKTGTVRQNMLGKRVNYSARTVIAPDCFIDTNQMGMPLKFALELTVPEYVTKYNVNFLRKLVINGPKVYPGAKMLRDTNGKIYNLSALTYNERVAKAKLLLVGLSEGNATKIVYRHILDGDVVLMNRQPTLHKPGIMAHFVKILTNQKIFRLNYVNCSTYNADFDGDEMNVHLPQDYLSQSEAQLIANADCQFVVPKNGQPIRGLIQDHCQGGALLTSRDTFFTKSEFFNLVYLSFNSFISTNSLMYLSKQDLHFVEEDIKLDVQLHQLAKRLKVLSDPFSRKITNRNIKIHLDQPAILYPKQLYTGKQVITCVLKTLIDNISVGLGDGEENNKYRGINLQSKSQTPGDAWGGSYDGDKEESTIIIRNSELLQGVLDKSQFGASSYGLTHLIYELLGPRVCGMLLNSFSYLFTSFLQMRGATCSPKDFLLTETAESERNKILKRIKYTGLHLQELFISLSRNTDNSLPNTNGGHNGSVNDNQKLLDELVSDFRPFYDAVKKYVSDVKLGNLDGLDSFGSFVEVLLTLFSSISKCNDNKNVEEPVKKYMCKLIERCSKVTKLRNLLLQYFAHLPPDSNLNLVQLKFPNWLAQYSDVDKTEPKQGDSTELSSTLNKNGLTNGNNGANYKLGDSYNTCMKFYKMVCNSPRENDLLSTFDRFFQNNIVSVSSHINELVDNTVVKFPRNGFATMVSTGAKGSKVNFAMISCALSQQTLEGKRVPVMPSVRTLPCFAFGDFGSRAGGFISDRFLTGLRPQEYFFHCMSGREGLVDTCVKTAKSGYLQRCVLKAMEDVIVCYDSTVRDSNCNIIQFKYGEDGIDVCKSSYLSQLQDLQVNEIYQWSNDPKNLKSSDPDSMELDEKEDGLDNGARLYLRNCETGTYNKSSETDSNFKAYYEKCKCEPGEAVGCIAGQSIGEPATQMTLNTFHLAGHGAANVTLGIPRLIEILQNTSHCSTPYFSVPILGKNEDEIAENAENAINALRMIYLSDIVQSVGMETSVYVNKNSEKEWEYVATIQFDDFNLFRKVIGHFNTRDIVKVCSYNLLSSFMKRVMGQMIVTMDINVPFELSDKTDQLEEFWNMFVMQKQIVKRDKLSTRIRKMILASGSSNDIPKKREAEDSLESEADLMDKSDHDSHEEMDEREEKDEFVEESEEETESSEDESEGDDEYESDDDEVEDQENEDDKDSDEEEEEEEEECMPLNSSQSSSATLEDGSMDLDKEPDDPNLMNLDEQDDIVSGVDDLSSPSASPTRIRSESSGIKSGNQRLFSINRKVFQFVKSLEFSEETSTMVLKFGWPVLKCPYFLDLLPLLKQEISQLVLRDSYGIRQSRIEFQTVDDKEEYTLHCDGTNLKRLFMLKDGIVDFNLIKMNDVATVLKYYGIEAARSCIVSELQKVFSVYGIKVNYRHLTLIADFMTQKGDVRTFTRYGMAKHTSPLLQMSFESTMKFLMQASQRGAYDNLKSPAGGLMAGKPVHVGSSLCRLMHVVDLKNNNSNKLVPFDDQYQF
ncbi:RNA polymerase Rpb1 domain 5 protein [Theileria parva strain Muguga]|uniref:DNA-directed RNA polymerase subunit n=1 Tax=Theileria parva TaxID=5875 RepID=Q4N7L1_THEPA|nr:RNA polymerase Rpb1 domain 5 protein [Theileria parva strain Muguga]EAN34047.1 RNA polymerase Rpb1 domain 5 protein [Theileria parva strain Muguga]|eukprot:XP_766330.1 RNA polymerase large subunit [Theileria parva strain Muguga]